MDIFLLDRSYIDGKVTQLQIPGIPNRKPVDAVIVNNKALYEVGQTLAVIAGKQVTYERYVKPLRESYADIAKSVKCGELIISYFGFFADMAALQVFIDWCFNQEHIQTGGRRSGRWDAEQQSDVISVMRVNPSNHMNKFQGATCQLDMTNAVSISYSTRLEWYRNVPRVAIAHKNVASEEPEVTTEAPTTATNSPFSMVISTSSVALTRFSPSP